MELKQLIRTMEPILGSEGAISEREELRSYECDGLMNYRFIPELVVLPECAKQVQRVFFSRVNATTVRVLAAEGCELVPSRARVAAAPSPPMPGARRRL